MIIFFVITVLLLLLIAGQLVLYFRVPQGVGLRKTILLRVVFLIIILGLCVYVWRATLFKEVQFQRMLLPYPEAKLNLLKTPVFSDSPYWTYTTSATPDQIFNWYRSRSKHAGWTIAEEGRGSGARVFVIKLDKVTSFFVVLQEEKNGTTIIYTTEGQLMRKNTPSI